jgi:ribosomal protein L29
MKLAEIMNKNDQDLAKLVGELQQQIADAAVEVRTKEVKNVKQVTGLKKSLARALTITRERQIAQEEQV